MHKPMNGSYFIKWMAQTVDCQKIQYTQCCDSDLGSHVFKIVIEPPGQVVKNHSVFKLKTAKDSMCIQVWLDCLILILIN